LELEPEILDVGCDELVFKPVRENDLFEAISRQLRISYRYARTKKSHGRDADVILTSDMLLELPTELIAGLHEATLVQDRQDLKEIIGRIKSLAPETAEGLRMLLDGFQLGRIKELLGDKR